MNNYLSKIFIAVVAIFSLMSCSQKSKPKEKEKAVVLWIDAEANFERLRTKEGIVSYIDKAKEVGFNTIVVDVKPVQGEALYNSDFLPKCTYLSRTTIEDRGFDYLEFFLKSAKERDLKVIVSATIMTMGLPETKTGPAYNDPYWEGKTAVEYLPSGMRDIKESKDWGIFAFLNPILPEVRSYAMRMVEEIATKYDFDGFALDYCRYNNINSDFSDASRAAFEKYANVKVENFPEDIFTYNSNDKNDYTPGKYFNQWIEWRTSVISSYVEEISSRVKAIKPNVKIHYWAASWWPLTPSGQNWASPSINSAAEYDWATDNYYKTGFADKIDVFQLGSYLPRVYGKDDNESVEYAIERAKKLIAGDCELYGTVSCSEKEFDLEDAIYLSLKESDGVMVFELSHIIRNEKWDDIKRGVERAKSL